MSWKSRCSRHRSYEREQRKRFAVSTGCSHRIWIPASDLSPNAHGSLLHARLEPSVIQASIEFKWSVVATDRWRLTLVTCCTLTPAAKGLVPEQLLPLVLLLLLLLLKSYSCNRLWKPIGMWDVEAPTFCLDNRLTDGGKGVSHTRRPPFTPQEYSWYSFLVKAESTPRPYCGWKD
jgi:hypothetical protein